MTGWDSTSRIRERLALLAALGPYFDPHYWAYHYGRDVWFDHTPSLDMDNPTEGRHAPIKVEQEATDSLNMILVRWGVEKEAAMELIGYREGLR